MILKTENFHFWTFISKMGHSSNLNWTTLWKLLSNSQAFFSSSYPKHIRTSESSWFPTELEYGLCRCYYIFGLMQNDSLVRFSFCQSKSAHRMMLYALQCFLRPWNQNFSQQYIYSPGRRQRCPATPFKICAPHVWPPVAAYIKYCILKMCPPLWLLAPPAAKSWRRVWSFGREIDPRESAIGNGCIWENFN